MEIAEHIATLDGDGRLMAVAAERAGLAAPVPSCPGWQVRDLLRHQGYVHRWAAGYVTEQHPDRQPRLTEAELLADALPEDELLDWFRAGHAALVSALQHADPAMTCWTFLDAPSPLAFWARRQANETAVHRVDAELAQGQVSPIGAEFATDGIDELIMGFFGRDAGWLTEAQRAGERRSLHVRATDTGGQWLIELTEDGTHAAAVSRGDGRADSTLSGPAAGLYLLLWNRVSRAVADVAVTGDESLLEAWRDGMRVTWG